MEELILLIAPVVLSLLLTSIITSAWIISCKKWHLFDAPDARKHHVSTTPTMGGIGIIGGMFISFFIFSIGFELGKMNAVIAASFILFITGFFDDLNSVTPQRKLIAQVIAGLVLVAGGIRIQNLHGIMGFYEVPLTIQYPLSLVATIMFINAFNFIDGIDGLAATLGLFASAIFGVLFFKYGQADYALLCFCLAGACLGFLFHNHHPAKVFMGDTGSLVIGLLLAAFATTLLNMSHLTHEEIISVSPALIFTVLFIPLYDFIRVVVIRILNGSSPLHPDRNHIHHTILRQGFGHGGATFILAFFNLGFIILQQVFSDMNINIFILMSILVAVISINSFVLSRIAFVRDKIFGKEKIPLN